ncbi:MAG TPA: HAD-IA family hydrolase [Ligilactobacillus saerimneri]|nr:HAD-IA family hydrolase [Ligilactobacillus saerimneri]
MQYYDYFWDFDGNLYNTYPVMTTALHQTLATWGLDVAEAELYRAMRRTSVGQTIKSYAQQVPVTATTIRQKYATIEAPQIGQARPFPYVREVCQAVVQAGGRNFLLTHRNQVAKQLLTRDHLVQYFTDFITGDDDFPRKPDPASLNYLCTKHNVVRHTAVMVGDRTLDIEAGHNAGLAGILFDFDDLIADHATADQVIHCFRELLVD